MLYTVCITNSIMKIIQPLSLTPFTNNMIFNSCILSYSISLAPPTLENRPSPPGRWHDAGLLTVFLDVELSSDRGDQRWAVRGLHRPQAKPAIPCQRHISSSSSLLFVRYTEQHKVTLGTEILKTRQRKHLA